MGRFRMGYPLSRYVSGLVVAALFFPAAASAQVRAPQFSDLLAAYPAGGQQGQTLTVGLDGKFLHDPVRALVSGAGVTVKAVRGRDAGRAEVDLSIAADAAAGIRSLRIAGRYGVSDPVWFQVGSLPEALEKEPNNSPSEATPVELPCVANGRLPEGEDVDLFRFKARAGQRVALAVTAFALDAQVTKGRFLDTTLTVRDASGRVLAVNEDFNSLDPALVFTVPADGEYSAEVRDMGYLGGPASVYRLTLGEVPYPTSVYPAGARRGEAVQVQVNGLNVAAGTSATVTAPQEAPVGWTWITPAKGAAAVPFVVGDYPEVLEQEPNDAAAQANAASLPTTLNGRLEKPGDQDSFRITLKKGEGFVADVLAGRVLRSPVDLTATVLDPNGREVAYNDDNPFTMEATHNRSDSLSGDPRLEFTAPADGIYTLLIRDAAARGGADCVYRVTLTRHQPGFDLVTWYDNPSIKGPGATGIVMVMLRRWGGYTGPVKLRIGGLPEGYVGSESEIPSITSANHQTSTILTLTAPESAKTGDTVPFWIEGEAQINGERFVRRAEPRAHLGQNADHSLFRRSESCVAGVVPVDEFRIKPMTTTVSGRAGEIVHFPVELTREAGFTGTISLLSLRGNLINFGPPMDAPAGETQFKMPLTIPANYPPGKYTFVLCRPMYGDFRSDRPHTSTPVLTLEVLAAKEAGR